LPEKRGRPTTDTGRAITAKERALAGLRLMQLREKRRDWRRAVDAGMAAALALTRDRLLAIPDRQLGGRGKRKPWWECEPVLQSKEQERKPPT
jgi:hypothetical protein